jgi:hypothetical protein
MRRHHTDNVIRSQIFREFHRLRLRLLSGVLNELPTARSNLKCFYRRN